MLILYKQMNKNEKNAMQNQQNYWSCVRATVSVTDTFSTEANGNERFPYSILYGRWHEAAPT